ncbi:MAG TPA: hypothetical protein DCP90_00660 [Clostridiales bacterium]|nr:MAG: hypothetical protein A2Y22_08080 [Clostridiales bacterium GWD2_32_59]HAN09108.1 hypothetical protein [Clostridiales bacterium]
MELDTIVIKTIDGTIMSSEFCEELQEYFKIKNVKIINKTGAPIPSSKIPEKRYEGEVNIMKSQIIWWYIQK